MERKIKTGSVPRLTAEAFVNIGNRAIAERGRFAVALSGGATPTPFYEMLASPEFNGRIDWNSVYFFFGDERKDRSNYQMAHVELLKPLGIAENRIFPWKIELPNTAEDYETEIRTIFDLREGEFPIFDLILLGLGEDGHTASLFPFSKTLEETKIATRDERRGRYTLTLATINNAANVIFLVSGAEKWGILKVALIPPRIYRTGSFPAQMVKPHSGNLIWIVDNDAANWYEEWNEIAGVEKTKMPDGCLGSFMIVLNALIVFLALVGLVILVV